MKAIVYTQYGPPEVLRTAEVEKPEQEDNEILVRIHAASVGYGDLLARNMGNTAPSQMHMPMLLCLVAKMSFGWSKPKVNILGSEFAGVIERTGRDVKTFKAGDAVFGYMGQRMGTNAEYLVMPEDGCVARKPAHMRFEEAATLPYGGVMAVDLLKRANIQPGQKVLVNGASGGIGSAAVQLAKYYGAEVTGVCGTPRTAYVRALGADRVIDYTQEDFTRGGETYHLIFDVLGKSDFSRSKRALKENGIHLYASFKSQQLLRQLLPRASQGGRRVICALATEKAENLRFIRELCEAGKMKAVVDRCFPMEQAVEAHRYAEAGNKQGSVVITF